MSDSLWGKLVLRRRSKAARSKDEAREMYGYEITGSHPRPGEWFRGELFLRLSEGLCSLRVRDTQQCICSNARYPMPWIVIGVHYFCLLNIYLLSTLSPVFWKEFNFTGHKSGKMGTVWPNHSIPYTYFFKCGQIIQLGLTGLLPWDL